VERDLSTLREVDHRVEEGRSALAIRVGGHCCTPIGM